MIEKIRQLNKEKADLHQRWLRLNEAVTSLRMDRPDLKAVIDDLEADAMKTYATMQERMKAIDEYQKTSCSHPNMEYVGSTSHSNVYECKDCGYQENN